MFNASALCHQMGQLTYPKTLKNKKSYHHVQQRVPAGAAWRPGTAPLPDSRPTSLLLYRTESSASTILDGSSCFMLFHQSAAGTQQPVLPGKRV